MSKKAQLNTMLASTLGPPLNLNATKEIDKKIHGYLCTVLHDRLTFLLGTDLGFMLRVYIDID